MSVLKARNRVVYFRVSEDEFHEFLKMCDAEKARSLSDLARSALQRMLRERQEGEMISDRLKTFDDLISRVNDKLSEMSDLIRANNQINRTTSRDVEQ
jgi:glutaredoxin 2